MTQYALALQTVEVLGEGAGIGLEKVVFESKGEKGINFGKGIVKREEIAWGAVGSNGEKVVKGWRYQSRQLVFG